MNETSVFRGHVARLSHFSRCTFSVSRLPASLTSPVVSRLTSSVVPVSSWLHRLHRVCVYLGYPGTLVSLPGSGPTNCEAVVVASCGLACSLHDVRHCSVLQYTAWYMRCCRRKTFRSMSFHGSAFQSSICRLLLSDVLYRPLLATLAIRPDLLHYLYLPSYRPHVSVSSSLQQSLGFLGHPPRLGLWPGRLLPFLEEPSAGSTVPCVHFV